MEAALREQNMCFPLCFIDVPAVRAKSKSEAKQEKLLESIVFYRPRRDSEKRAGVTLELGNRVYYCNLRMQMRCPCIAKTITKKCDVQFLLCFFDI